LLLMPDLFGRPRNFSRALAGVLYGTYRDGPISRHSRRSTRQPVYFPIPETSGLDSAILRGCGLTRSQDSRVSRCHVFRHLGAVRLMIAGVEHPQTLLSPLRHRLHRQVTRRCHHRARKGRISLSPLPGRSVRASSILATQGSQPNQAVIHQAFRRLSRMPWPPPTTSIPSPQLSRYSVDSGQSGGLGR
jgi:hypothetical protein